MEGQDALPQGGVHPEIPQLLGPILAPYGVRPAPRRVRLHCRRLPPRRQVVAEPRHSVHLWVLPPQGVRGEDRPRRDRRPHARGAETGAVDPSGACLHQPHPRAEAERPAGAQLPAVAPRGCAAHRRRAGSPRGAAGQGSRSAAERRCGARRSHRGRSRRQRCRRRGGGRRGRGRAAARDGVAEGRVALPLGDEGRGESRASGRRARR
mmetsp:Transcript_118540/g.342762  ORF Transcript_118540/g.342762 Transcript_118540/m.342762 type:complete len:208 (+) Transcript_118540:332-955(+)